MHFSSPENLILAYDGYVVFALTGNNAGIASGAKVQINAHCPLVQAELIRILIGVIGMLVG